MITQNPSIPKKDSRFTEKELYEKFRVQTMGGIRYTRKHNYVILIDSALSNYDDHVDEESKTVTYMALGKETNHLKV